MNQKRITNQILEQKNFTLNSTLNYLFNISNMKKLFSYLLISSMVVLSSCTNYDDQFDDLNTQINSLKSQIEGFSSLSSGLTALQGTVSSLQSAVAALPKTATPATDISGLEASVAALQTQLASASTSAEVTAITTQLTAAQTALADAIAANATAADANASSIAGNATAIENLLTELEALATSLAGIKTDLAAADTSDAVAQLALDLAAAQANLTTLLAQNNVFTGTLNIRNAAELSAAEQLGDKVTIINGAVNVTQSDTSIDAAKLQAVVSKITVITDKLTYSHSGTGVTAVNFDKLTSVGDMAINQEAPVTFAALTSAANVDVVSNLKVTAVDFPVLTKVTTLADGTAAGDNGDFEFSAATSVDLGSLVRYTPGDLQITTKSTGTVDLASLETTSETTGLQSSLTLGVSGPKVLSLPLVETAALTTNAQRVTLPKLTSVPTFTNGATNLKELHMHNLMAPITLTSYAQLEILDIIGTYLTTGISAATLAGARATGVEATGVTSLETLTLAGALGVVKITGAGNLTSVTTSGGMRSFELDGATDLTSLTLGHGANASSTKKRSDLIITGATSLETLVADSVNYATKLDISGNTSLTSISLAGLTALATETSQKNIVKIQNNKLEAQSVQIASASTAIPLVEGSVTTNSGIKELKVYLDKAIAAATSTGESVRVDFDNVVQIVTVAGDVLTATTATKTANTGITASNSSVVSAVDQAGWIFINIFPSTPDTASVKETRTYTFAVATEGDNFTDTALNGDDIVIGSDGVDKTFAGGTGATDDYTTVTAMLAAINAFDFGSTTVTAARDAQKVLKSRLSYTKAGVATSITNITATDKFIFKLGTVTKTYTNPTIVASSADGITMTELGEIIASTMTGTVVAGKKYNVAESNGVLTITGLITNTELVDYGNITYPSFSIVVTNTTGYQSLGASTNTAAAMTASGVAIGASNVTVNGVRITLQNDSFSAAFESDDDVSVAGFNTVTTVVSGTHTYGNSSWVIPFSSAVDNSGTGSNLGVIDATAWL